MNNNKSEAEITSQTCDATFKKLNEAKSPEDRFYALGKAALASFNLVKYDDARKYVQELEELTPQFENNWNYSNAIHHINIILGRLALREGKTDEAKEYLLKAGQISGSPQKNTFGPNMSLAKDLLEKGEKEVVLEYFELCRKFWTSENNELNKWAEEVNQGNVPNFGGNLFY